MFQGAGDTDPLPVDDAMMTRLKTAGNNAYEVAGMIGETVRSKQGSPVRFYLLQCHLHNAGSPYQCSQEVQPGSVHVWEGVNRYLEFPNEIAAELKRTAIVATW